MNNCNERVCIVAITEGGDKRNVICRDSGSKLTGDGVFEVYTVASSVTRRTSHLRRWEFKESGDDETGECRFENAEVISEYVRTMSR